MIDIDIDIDYKDLKNLIKSLEKDIKVKVGMLAGKGGDELVVDQDDLDLAGLGAQHEFGHGNIPVRSFLEMPFDVKNDEFFRLLKDLIDVELLKDKNSTHLADEIGLCALAIIAEAFDTQGFGQWEDNAPYTIAIKGRNEPLVDTGKMRDTINFEVI